MNLEELPIRVRPAVEGDVPFIFSSWLKSYRSAITMKQVINTVYFAEHHKVIESLLKTSTTYVICDDKDPTNIYGYICAEEVDGIFVLHYVYVKHNFRGLGLGKLLLNQFNHETGSAGMCTHLTKIAEKLAEKFGFVFSPYIALTPEYDKKRKDALDKRMSIEMEEAREAVKEE